MNIRIFLPTKSNASRLSNSWNDVEEMETKIRENIREFGNRREFDFKEKERRRLVRV